MEKRRAERHKKRLNIKFGIEKADNIGFIEDISATGLRIKTSHVYKPGTKIYMELTDRDTHVMLAEGIVTWARKVPPQMMRMTRCGMGIAFLRIDVNLANFMKENNIVD